MILAWSRLYLSHHPFWIFGALALSASAWLLPSPLYLSVHLAAQSHLPAFFLSSDDIAEIQACLMLESTAFGTPLTAVRQRGDKGISAKRERRAQWEPFHPDDYL